MRHQKAGIKLNRTSSHRNAMFRNMVTSLLKHEQIRTTDAKAKELRRWADHLITLAKRGDLHARRQALSIVREKKIVHHLFEIAGKRYGNANGGYTRVVKLGRRPGDAARMSLVELIDFESQKKEKSSKKKSKTQAEKTPSDTIVKSTESKSDTQKPETALTAKSIETAESDTLEEGSETEEDTASSDIPETEISPGKKDTTEPDK